MTDRAAEENNTQTAEIMIRLEDLTKVFPAQEEAAVDDLSLEIYEGDTLEVELVNNTDQRLSIHPHGVDYDVNSDGAIAYRVAAVEIAS